MTFFLSLPGADQVVIVWAILLAVVALAYIAREIRRAKHKDIQPPIDSHDGVLRLILKFGPMTMPELHAAGVVDPPGKVDHLLMAGMLSREKIQQGFLYGLSEAGRRRITAERGQ